jgi:hypothetical protein
MRYVGMYVMPADNPLKIEKSALHTRKYAQEMMEQADREGYPSVDLSNLNFISRSVGDELIYRSKMYGIPLENAQGDVKHMLEVIESRKVPA